MCGVYPDADVKTAGEQISSTYEGRHVTLFEDELTHPDHEVDGVNLVQKGDPVVFGKAVGIAFESAIAATDLIAIDTEGIWIVDVEAADDAGASAVIPGDRLYIHVADCTVSKKTHDQYNVPFGYALGAIGAGDTETIAVKLHAGQLIPAIMVGNKLLAGDFAVYGALSFNGTVGVSGVLTCNGGIACNSYLGVAGIATFGGLSQIVMVVGSVAHLGGDIVCANLPVADPHFVGQLWNNGGVVTASAG